MDLVDQVDEAFRPNPNPSPNPNPNPGASGPYRFPSVGPGQLSVRNGVAGSPVSFVKFGWRGLLLKA